MKKILNSTEIIEIMEFVRNNSLKSRYQKIDFEMHVYIGFGHKRSFDVLNRKSL